MKSLFIVSCLLLVGLAGAVGWSRWWFVHAGDAFLCKIRACGDPSVLWPRLARRWPRRRMWAKWVGDVLVVWRGPVMTRSVQLPARVAHAGVYSVPSWDPKRCGRRPIAVHLLVSDGSCVEVAAADTARLALVGPYVAAAINDLPRTPVPRRWTWGWSP
jgi:hypothetical protein